MYWLKKNSFLAGLAGVTVLALGGMVYFGMNAITRYQEAKERFDAAFSEASSIENTKPYPLATNLDAKKKAVEDYKKEVELLQDAFSPFRPGQLEMVSPEAFIERLKKVNVETRAAAERNALMVPDAYFCGFKEYTGRLPSRNATGILGYQLEGIREAMLALAASGATELKNLHRPLLEEESSAQHKPAADAVARALPMEITFKGPEKALRNFVTSLSKTDRHYWVIRSLRVSNMKKDPPRTSDAKFGTPAAAAGRAAKPAFEEFVFDDEEAPAEGKPAEAPAEPAPPTAEGDRILALVLGNEELLVHVRLDLMMFLDPKPLP